MESLSLPEAGPRHPPHERCRPNPFLPLSLPAETFRRKGMEDRVSIPYHLCPAQETCQLFCEKGKPYISPR